MTTKETWRFTGTHMFLVMLLFFGTIISVNVIMAVAATGSWSGLVVKNSYVASQQFNAKLEDMKRQQKLGWTVAVTASETKVAVALNDAGGKPVAAKLSVAMTRPNTDHDDHVLTLALAPSGRYEAETKLGAGAWDATVTAVDGKTESFVTTKRLYIEPARIAGGEAGR